MRFSARQQHCLQAMGVVPWVSRFAVAPERVAAPAEPALVAEEVEVSTEVPVAPVAGVTPELPVAAVAVAGADVMARDIPSISEEPVLQFLSTFTAEPPGAVGSLGAWLLSGALAPIRHRGTEFPVLGPAEARVLVIVQQADKGLATAALEGDAARLFDLMLRSIKLSGRDTRQCIMSGKPLAEPEMSVAGAGCTPHTRAVLVLQDAWPFGVGETNAAPHQSRLPGPGSQLPLWRMAHPRLLLEQPMLKRQSWQILKALQAQMNIGSSL